MVAGDHHGHDTCRTAFADGIKRPRARRIDQPGQARECPVSAEFGCADLAVVLKIVTEGKRKHSVAMLRHLFGGFHE